MGGSRLGYNGWIQGETCGRAPLPFFLLSSSILLHTSLKIPASIHQTSVISHSVNNNKLILTI